MRIAAFSMLAALMLAGCIAKPTMPMADILASNLNDEALLDAYGKRLRHLASDAKAFDAEMVKAGFVEQPRDKDCGAWELPDNAKGLRAFAHFCRTASGGVDLARIGILRGPMTYD